MLQRGEKCSLEGLLLLCLPTYLFFYYSFYKLYLSLHCLSLSLYSASKLCLHLLPSPLLHHTLRSSLSPPSVFLSLTLLTAAFEVLTVVTSWVWQGSPSKAGPHDYPATSFEWPSPTPLSWELIGCNLSQWEKLSLGQVDTTREDVGYLTDWTSLCKITLQKAEGELSILKFLESMLVKMTHNIILCLHLMEIIYNTYQLPVSSLFYMKVNWISIVRQLW